MLPEAHEQPSRIIFHRTGDKVRTRRPAPRTMILLDPDLDSGSRANLRSRTDSSLPTHSGLQTRARAAKRHAGRETSGKNLRIPSARGLTPFLKRAQAAVRLPGEVTVLLTTDSALRKLNRRFRGKDKATDVLSFPADPLVRSPERLAGDLAISVETARRQGAARGHSLETEIKILMLHGLLHLKGFDHESDDGEMAREERRLRARLGLAQGLIERAGFRKGKTADPSTPIFRNKRTIVAQDDSHSRMPGSVRSHPSRKNKNAARAGRPDVHGDSAGENRGGARKTTRNGAARSAR